MNIKDKIAMKNHKNIKSLRLVLGDQLNIDHSWYQQKDPEVLYLIAELKQETSYVTHHVQKVSAFFAAMEQFANTLAAQGHLVRHLTLDDTANFKDLPGLLLHTIDELGCERFEYQRPDEYRLREQMVEFCSGITTQNKEVDSEHFLLPFEEIGDYFAPQKHVRMETFYRKMRRRFKVLMEDNEPTGGRWNFDSENRQTFKQTELKSIPSPLCFTNDVRDILTRLSRNEIKTIGKAASSLLWPISQEQGRELLAYFCRHQLPSFGRYQDAMTCNSEHQWSLYHSRLSFAINAKLIAPIEVIDTAIKAFRESEGEINLAQVEGFVRQILGWREYVRGMYWVNMPNYAIQNELKGDRPLPKWFWTGDTKMQCMRAAITQSLDYAYAHHIQRLMITGNFALLAGIKPAEVDQWYLGIYVDAIEWVELPNTRGMALFADGGLIATKPYAASGNYVNKMSDYCKNCEYSVKHKTEDNACPLNSLYWNFIDRHYNKLKQNSRMAFPIKNWEKQNETDKQNILSKAQAVLSHLDAI
jgi:deoxyribodipyrimidine photolyase-related protein